MKLVSVASGILAALLGVAAGLILSIGGVALKTETKVNPVTNKNVKQNDSFITGRTDYGSRQPH